MSGTRIAPSRNTVTAQGRPIRRYPDQTGEFIAPHMRRDARVIITRPEVVVPGLRLGDWSQIEAEARVGEAVGRS